MPMLAKGQPRRGRRLAVLALLAALALGAGCGRQAPSAAGSQAAPGPAPGKPAGSAAGAAGQPGDGLGLSHEDRVKWGAAIFRANCASCHGEGGRGGRAVALARPELARKYPTDEALIARIRDGDPSTGMPPCASLQPEHYRALAAYIRSLAAPPGGPPAGG